MEKKDKSHSVTLVIDHREHAIIKAFEGEKEREKEKEKELEVKALDVGDFHIMVNGTLAFVIERKTLADLESSIKDGRYSEQKTRALKTLPLINPNVKFMYVLEGSGAFSFDDSNQRSKMLSSAILNTTFRDQCSFIFCKDLKETVRFLNCMVARSGDYVALEIKRNKEKEREENKEKDDHQDEEKEEKETKDVKEAKSYETCLQQAVTSKKKENIDKTRCFIHQLCCIPGISIKKAESIAQTHQVDSMTGLLEKMKGMTVKAFSKDTPGIGSILAKQLYESL